MTRDELIQQSAKLDRDIEIIKFITEKVGKTKNVETLDAYRELLNFISGTK